jgi:hypothetical protein
LFLLIFGVLYALANARPSTPSTPGGAGITIRRVQVSPEQITFAGEGALPDGTCLQTRLYADGQPQVWWPAAACVPVRGGAWQGSVTLGGGRAPVALDPAVQYVLHAWRKGATSATPAVFAFDMVGPPTPSGNEN